MGVVRRCKVGRAPDKMGNASASALSTLPDALLVATAPSSGLKTGRSFSQPAGCFPATSMSTFVRVPEISSGICGAWPSMLSRPSCLLDSLSHMAERLARNIELPERPSEFCLVSFSSSSPAVIRVRPRCPVYAGCRNRCGYGEDERRLGLLFFCRGYRLFNALQIIALNTLYMQL